jgi:hypothetical protein
MKKGTLTYTAPPGESKTLEIAGATLLSGESKPITCDDALMAKLEAAAKGNPMLKVSGVSDHTPPPPKPPEPAKHDDDHDHKKGKAA